MLLAQKNAIIYGSGSVGAAVAAAFAREGARVFLAGRNEASLASVAKAIADGGGTIETTQLDVLDENAVAEHAAMVQRMGGSIDISLNAVLFPTNVGRPLAQMAADDFTVPIERYMRAHFLTTRVAAQHMNEQRAGVILNVSGTMARTATPNFGGLAIAWASIEALTRSLAAELGPQGVRVICMRNNAIPESETIRRNYTTRAQATGTTFDDVVAQAAMATPLRRLPTLTDLANTATFLASDQNMAMTAAVVNLTCGALAD